MKAFLVALTLLTTTLTLRAAPALPARLAPSATTAQLSQFKLGNYITGPQLTLADAAGKAVLIDAWGIHCGPCLASLPDIEKIAKHYKGKMLVFGAHSQAGTDAEVKGVVNKNKLTYTIANGVNSPISFSGIPHVFVFDTTGTLVFTGSPFDKEFERSLHKATQGAQASAPAATPSGLDALKAPASPTGSKLGSALDPKKPGQ